MICKKCGSQVGDQVKFCPSCGNNMQSDVEASVTPTMPSTQPAPVTPLPPITPVVPAAPVPPTPVAPMPGSMVGGTPSGKKPNKGVIIAIIVAIVIVVGAIIAVVILNNDDVNTPPTPDTSSNTSTNTSSNTNTDSNTNTNTSSNTNTNINPNTNTNGQVNNVSLDGFKFSIPTRYQYEEDGSSLNILNLDNGGVAIFAIEYGSYDIIVSALDQLKSTLTAQDMNVIVCEARNVGGVDLLVMELETTDGSLIMTYSKLTEDRMLMATVTTNDKKADYNLLTEIIPIISSVVPDNGSSSF